MAGAYAGVRQTEDERETKRRERERERDIPRVRSDRTTRMTREEDEEEGAGREGMSNVVSVK